MRFLVIGAGRAGTSLATALESRGWVCAGLLGRDDDTTEAADQADVVIIAVPDRSIADVAAAITPGRAVLLHLSGATGLDALHPHDERGSIHPLVSLPDIATGSRRLLDGATFAVAGHPVAAEIVEVLGGRAIAVDDSVRPIYHAAASVGANHLVALCAQVERLATAASVPVDVFWELMARALDNVKVAGAAAALTGPAARGDHDTIAAHLRAIDPAERGLYLAMADAAAELAGQPPPSGRRGTHGSGAR